MNIKPVLAGIGAIALVSVAACGSAQPKASYPSYPAPTAPATVNHTAPAAVTSTSTMPVAASSSAPAPDGIESPSAGASTCTTTAGYYPGGLPGHIDASGFCVADPDPAATQTQPAPAPRQLIRIQQIGGGEDSTTTYQNYWSDGTETICQVHVFDDGDQVATGDCAPDGIANGSNGGGPGPN